MTNLNAVVATESKPSTKLVAEWSGQINVGIYDNCTWTIRLYEDRAIVRMPGVKWTGNTGGYHLYRTRETGARLQALLCLARHQSADIEDYAEQALACVSGC